MTNELLEKTIKNGRYKVKLRLIEREKHYHYEREKKAVVVIKTYETKERKRGHYDKYRGREKCLKNPDGFFTSPDSYKKLTETAFNEAREKMEQEHKTEQEVEEAAEAIEQMVQELPN